MEPSPKKYRRPETLESIKNRLIDVVLLALVFLGFPAIVASLLRIRDVGWLNSMILHVAAWVGVLTVYLFRTKLPRSVKGGIILAIIFIVGTGSFPTLGNAGSGIFFYLVAVVIATIVFGVRVGALTLLTCLAVLVGFFLAVRSGNIILTVDFNRYVLATSSWLVKIATFAMFSALTMTVLGKMQRWLIASMEEMQQEIRERRKAEEKLIESRNQLETSLMEKEVLLKEIHHRVKNNLQAISGLFNLQAAHAKDEEVNKVFRESQNRINSMALIHERLYQVTDLNRIDFSDYVYQLVRHLKVSYGATAENVFVRTDCQEVVFNLDTAIPCGLIVTELVSNALVHAFPDNRPGEVWIRIEKGANGEFIMSVSDNGIGLPRNVDVENPDSLGLILVKSFVQLLSGTIQQEGQEGTVFRIVFKEYEECGADRL